MSRERYDWQAERRCMHQSRQQWHTTPAGQASYNEHRDRPYDYHETYWPSEETQHAWAASRVHDGGGTGRDDAAQEPPECLGPATKIGRGAHWPNTGPAAGAKDTSHMTATRRSARQATPSLTQNGQVSATDLSNLVPGDEYVVTWNDGDRQRYRVVEVRGQMIVRKRWIASLGKWTEWDGVQSIAQVCRHKVEMA